MLLKCRDFEKNGVVTIACVGYPKRSERLFFGRCWFLILFPARESIRVPEIGLDLGLCLKGKNKAGTSHKPSTLKGQTK